MSRCLMIVLSATMAITCVLFACVLKWNGMTSWGWFLLCGCVLWGNAINLYEKREAHPMFDDQVDLAAEENIGSNKNCS